MSDQLIGSAVGPTTTAVTTARTTPASRPVCSWVPVTDGAGRTLLEARWSVPGAATAATRAA
jgi:hypothetical protein